MQARMKNPAMIIPDAMQALQALGASAEKAGLPAKTLGLVHLRASRINGCGMCCDMHPRLMRKAGETDERMHALAAWRDAPYFTDAERAALALTEAVTRSSDRPDPVPDDVERGCSSLRRTCCGLAASLNREHQRVEPAQRRHTSGCWFGPVGRELVGQVRPLIGMRPWLLGDEDPGIVQRELRRLRETPAPTRHGARSLAERPCASSEALVSK